MVQNLKVRKRRKSLTLPYFHTPSSPWNGVHYHQFLVNASADLLRCISHAAVYTCVCALDTAHADAGFDFSLGGAARCSACAGGGLLSWQGAPGHSQATGRTQPGHSADTARPQPGHSQATGQTQPGHSADTARPQPGHSADTTGPPSGHSRATARPQCGHSRATARTRHG